jgi:hypothetical protein
MRIRSINESLGEAKRRKGTCKRGEETGQRMRFHFLQCGRVVEASQVNILGSVLPALLVVLCIIIIIGDIDCDGDQE